MYNKANYLKAKSNAKRIRKESNMDGIINKYGPDVMTPIITAIELNDEVVSDVLTADELATVIKVKNAEFNAERIHLARLVHKYSNS